MQIHDHCCRDHGKANFARSLALRIKADCSTLACLVDSAQFNNVSVRWSDASEISQNFGDMHDPISRGIQGLFGSCSSTGQPNSAPMAD